MLSIVCTEASKFENSLLNKNFTIKIDKGKYFIGRGEQLEEKESQTSGIIDLTNFDNTLSRVHASLNFSPAWFVQNQDSIPHYMHQINYQQKNLPPDVVQKIWEFIKPQKKCILKDLKSKVGIFSKIDNEKIQSQMIIEFVHQSFIKFEYFEQYEIFEELSGKVKFYQDSEPAKNIIFGNLEKIKFHYNSLHDAKEKLQLLKLWHFSIKETKYILLIEQNLILRIGRSSHCQIQIKDTAISRYQAYLKCENRKWKVVDGNQLEKSKNGTWKRQKTISIPVSTNQNDVIKIHVKIGTIKCEIYVIEKFSWLNIQKIAKGDVSKSFIEIGMGDQAQGTILQKEETLINQS